VVFQNVWLFEVAGGRLVSAQLYADTAAVRSSAGWPASSASQAPRTRPAPMGSGICVTAAGLRHA